MTCKKQWISCKPFKSIETKFLIVLKLNGIGLFIYSVIRHEIDLTFLKYAHVILIRILRGTLLIQHANFAIL